MPRDAILAEISQIFLSATADDCKQYREAVRDFVHENLETAKIFLQEDWSKGGQFVVDVCEAKIRECDAYFGLFGHRYGWVPPGYTKSITELEFRWAAARWSGPTVPIFILLPEKGSDADRDLRCWALPCLAKDFADEAGRAAAEQVHQEFLQSVTQWAANGRMLVYYRDRWQLVGKALSCIQNWNLDLLRRALNGRREPAGNIPGEELGRISWDQREALTHALEALRDRASERAACFVVHGPENHGQRQFADFLSRWEEWDDTPVFSGQAADADSIESLICWTCGQLKTPMLGQATVAGLADIVAARLGAGSVILVLRSLGRRPDRLMTFQRQFWQPLVDALVSRAPRGHGRIYAFLLEHETLPAAPMSGILTHGLADPNLDYRNLLALPSLGSITAVNVRRWLKELKTTAGITIDEGRRQAIATAVTQPDAAPANVYDRLARENFWVETNVRV
jgi:Domain of unknown function (DUF4062)/inactive STAND